MQLSEWVCGQIRANGGVLHVGDSEVSLEEVAEELDRRLDGICYSPRITVSSSIGIEALTRRQVDNPATVEALRQVHTAAMRVPIQFEKEEQDKRGRPPKVFPRVVNQIIVGLSHEKYDPGMLRAAKQEWIKKEFDCHHKTYWKALVCALTDR